jgi:hypothetical protein
MASHIERRKFLATLGGAAAWPLAAHAQQQTMPVIGFIVAGTPLSHGQWVAAFVQRLRELGWIEGRTIAIEYRWGEGRNERFAEIAAEFVRRKVDVIVTSATAQSWLPSKRRRSSPSFSRRRATPSAPAWLRVWRVRAATSLAYRFSNPMLRPSDLSCCGRLSLVSAGWRSWAMSAVPPSCWICARSRQRPARSALRLSH